MDRRRFLASAALGAAGLSTRALPNLPATTPRLSIADYAPYLHQPTEKIQKRFDLYRQIGVGTVRAGVDWRVLERSNGNWQVPPFLRSYLTHAITSGFRLKLTVGTVGAPPGWYLDAHPDARIRNAKGEYSKNDMSLWYPKLGVLLAEKADGLFGHLAQLGAFAVTDFIFVDLGPAGEPLYPAPWTMGEAHTHGPWFYDAHAATAFAQRAKRAHPRLAEANRSWGTNFASWSDVKLPRPGERFGGLWQEALLWYRESKRRFVRWQVANYRRALERHAPGARTRLIIFVPAVHIQPEEWGQAVRSGNPSRALVTMDDSEFLLRLAQKTGCWLQDTGVENATELQYLRGYMKDHGINQPMWGENAGLEAVARNPGHLADVVLANGLYGLDYIDSHYLFRPDGVTPNETFNAFATASERIRRALH